MEKSFGFPIAVDDGTVWAGCSDEVTGTRQVCLYAINGSKSTQEPDLVITDPLADPSASFGYSLGTDAGHAVVGTVPDIRLDLFAVNASVPTATHLDTYVYADVGHREAAVCVEEVGTMGWTGRLPNM